MVRWTISALLLAASVFPASGRSPEQAGTNEAPRYTAEGRLSLPTAYREWVFLTSGLDMSYASAAAPSDHSMFDNVFVNPSSYRAFLQTGAWPDKTTFILEIRGAEGASSINKRGHTQSKEIMGMEVHVKDSTLPGGWGFFDADQPDSAKPIKRPASCYECHESHGAVDTTFVQFYPTLLELARTKKTLTAAYLKDSAQETEQK